MFYYRYMEPIENYVDMNKKQLCVLIVDDDTQLRNLIKETFQLLGNLTITATNGAEALKVLKVTEIDLIILDVIMPEKEGLETLLEIKKLNQDAKIIVMSGGTNNLHASMVLTMAEKLGADTTLKKPFYPDEIIQVAYSLIYESTLKRL